ncbi:hypothetical protein L798_13056 [Zootermopsis nevadensis]|uniref:Uncharacterized protein n=1 Tax=Zootermopsis nevadensis TaxID=136037 RepID=A0A067R1J5_ZOONE|nr:hypothetical protein L798_13056 [Zootermopsis nevadensis]
MAQQPEVEPWPPPMWEDSLPLILLTNHLVHARKVPSHAINLRHGTAGFASPPKEVVLRIFIILKIHRPRPCLNLRTLGPVASMLTTSPPRATVLFIINKEFTSH